MLIHSTEKEQRAGCTAIIMLQRQNEIKVLACKRAILIGSKIKSSFVFLYNVHVGSDQMGQPSATISVYSDPKPPSMLLRLPYHRHPSLPIDCLPSDAFRLNEQKRWCRCVVHFLCARWGPGGKGVSMPNRMRPQKPPTPRAFLTCRTQTECEGKGGGEGLECLWLDEEVPIDEAFPPAASRFAGHVGPELAMAALSETCKPLLTLRALTLKF